jgi:hypothetical protein
MLQLATLAMLSGAAAGYAADGPDSARCAPKTPCPRAITTKVQPNTLTNEQSQYAQPIVRLRRLDLTALPAGAFGDVEPDTQLTNLADPRRKR